MLSPEYFSAITDGYNLIASTDGEMTLENAEAWGAGGYIGLGLRILTTLVSFLLNLVGLHVIAHSKRWKQPKGVILLSLTTNDFLISTVSMTLATLQYSAGSEATGNWYCNEKSAFCFVPISTLTLALLCMERFVAIYYPYWHLAHATPSRAAYLCLACWVTGALYPTITISQKITYSATFQQCFSYPPIHVVVLGILLHAVILSTSILVYKKANDHRRQMARQDAISGTVSHSSDVGTVNEFRGLLYVVISFVVSGIPACLIHLRMESLDIAKPYFMWCMYCFSIFNILIYGYNCKWFREACRSLLVNICICELSSNRENVNVAVSVQENERLEESPV